MGVPDLVLRNLLIRVAVRNVSCIASRRRMVDGGCHDKPGLESLTLCGFED